MEPIQGDVLEAVAVRQMVIAISYFTLKRPAWWNFIDVPVLHGRAGGLVTEVPGLQMAEPSESAIGVDHVEHLICFLTLQEDDTDPPSNRVWINAGSFAPSNATCCCGRCVESLFCLVDQGRCVVEFVGGCKSILRPDGVVTVIIKRARTILDMGCSELVEHLLERSHA